MALVIVNARHILPEDRNKPENARSDIRYGATREGVQKLNENLRPMSDNEGLNYIANRRGAESFDGDGDGLFGANGKADLDAAVKDFKDHPDSIEWRFVVSFEKEKLAAAGYNSAAAAQPLFASIMPDIGKMLNISPENLHWYAAYHPIDKNGQDHHPHFHVYCFSSNPEEGRLRTKNITKKQLEKIRSKVTHSVFEGQMQAIEGRQQAARQLLVACAKGIATDPDWAIKSGVYEDLYRLRDALPESGKMLYGYMPKGVKQQIDDIVRKICASPAFEPAYTALRNAQEELIKVYNDDPKKIASKMQTWEKHFFHPTGKNDSAQLHNTVISIVRGLSEVPEPEPDDVEPWNTSPSDETPEPLPTPLPWGEDTELPQKDLDQELLDAAVAGDLPSMLKVSERLIEIDPQLARTFVEAAAYEKQSVDGYLLLGKMEQKLGNDADAARAWRVAADAGNTKAMAELAKIYRNSPEIHNPDLGYMWAQKAAESGKFDDLLLAHELALDCGDTVAAQSYLDDASVVVDTNNKYREERGERPNMYQVRQLAKAHLENGDLSLAIADYGDVLVLSSATDEDKQKAADQMLRWMLRADAPSDESMEMLVTAAKEYATPELVDKLDRNLLYHYLPYPYVAGFVNDDPALQNVVGFGCDRDPDDDRFVVERTEQILATINGLPEHIEKEIKDAAVERVREITISHNLHEAKRFVRETLLCPEAGDALEQIPAGLTANTLSDREQQLVDQFLPQAAMRDIDRDDLREIVLEAALKERLMTAMKDDRSLLGDLAKITKPIREALGDNKSYDETLAIAEGVGAKAAKLNKDLEAEHKANPKRLAKCLTKLSHTVDRQQEKIDQATRKMALATGARIASMLAQAAAAQRSQGIVRDPKKKREEERKNGKKGFKKRRDQREEERPEL